jgi:hypothetical protein
MTKQDAIQLMSQGVKITHIYFDAKEWMTIDRGFIRLEDGVICDQDEFWKHRTCKVWDDGYMIFQE